MTSQSERVQHDRPTGDEPTPARTGSPLPASGTTGGGWTVGRVIAVIAGSLLLFFSLGVLGAGALLVVMDQTQRTGGYLPISQRTYSTGGYALASEQISLHGGWEYLEPLLGDVRIQVTSSDPSKPVFVAIAKASPATRFLSHTAYTVISRSGDVASHQGHAPSGPPGAAGIWTAQATGTGVQTLTWTPGTGDWMVVVMNADGSAGLTARADVTISAPMLLTVGVEMLVSGLLLGTFAAALIWVPARLAAGTGPAGP